MKSGGHGSTALVIFAFFGLSALPLGEATPTKGHTPADGSLLLPQSTRAEMSGIVSFLNDSSTLEHFELEADFIHVCRYSISGSGVSLPGENRFQNMDDVKGACFGLEDAKLGLVAGNQEGWVGLRVEPDQDLKLFSPESFRLSPRSNSRLADGNSDTASTKSHDEPHQSFFVQEINTPHLFSVVKGTVAYTGKGELKIEGPDFQIAAASNTTTYRTGETWTRGVVDEGRLAWVVIQFSNARVNLTSAEAPFQLAASDVRSFTLESPPTRAPLAPVPDSRFPWPLLLLGLAAVGAGGLVVHRRLRGSGLSLGLEPCWVYGSWVMEHGHYDRALPWIQRARAMAPREAGLVADEARCRYELGDLQAALGLLEKAHHMVKGGDYALLAAQFLRDSGEPIETIEKHLADALEKSPNFLDEIEEEFPEVVTRPGWATVARVARLRSR